MQNLAQNPKKSATRLKMARFVFLGPKQDQNGAKSTDSISPEPLIAASCLTPQNNCRPNISIVFCRMITNKGTGCAFLGQKQGQDDQKCTDCISSERLIAESWLTPQNNCRPNIFIVFYHQITCHSTESATFGQKQGRNDQKCADCLSSERLIAESWLTSQNNCRPNIKTQYLNYLLQH